MVIHNIKRLRTVRKKLRFAPTPAEAMLWKALRNSQLEGKKFRRQHSIGPYILDFYCPECRLAIELDGAGHYEMLGAEYDAERTEFLTRHSIRILRFENRDVLEMSELVTNAIRQELVS